MGLMLAGSVPPPCRASPWVASICCAKTPLSALLGIISLLFLLSSVVAGRERKILYPPALDLLNRSIRRLNGRRESSSLS
jgi:hypothetical protein